MRDIAVHQHHIGVASPAELAAEQGGQRKTPGAPADNENGWLAHGFPRRKGRSLAPNGGVSTPMAVSRTRRRDGRSCRWGVGLRVYSRRDLNEEGARAGAFFSSLSLEMAQRISWSRCISSGLVLAS